MSKQTINIGASPNDGTGTPLRTSFDYTNQNFTELYTALGGGVGLPGATTQVIFNDGGTNLAGDAGLVYNKTTDALTVAGLVTAGSASITGAATVGTTLGVTGASTLASVGVTGAATVGTTLGVTGNITGSGADPNFNNGSLNLFLSGGTTGDPAISFSRYGSASLNNRGAKIQYVYRVASAQESGSLAFYSNPNSAGTGSLVERMRIDYTGDVSIATGNVVMSTSGKGIDFSATANSSGTMTSELLNDYEEGTWTPVVTAVSGTLTTVTGQVGTYTKIGRMVTATGYFQITTNGTGSSAVALAGLPFANGGLANIGVGRVDGTTGNMFQVKINASASTANIWKYDNTYPAADGSAFPMTLVYYV